jgi:sugar phosphate permease
LTELGRPIPKARWYRVGFLLFLTYLFAFIDRSNIGMAAPDMIKELGLSSVSMGILLSAFFWGYILTQVPGGVIAQKFSCKWVIIITMIGWGFFSGLTGFMRTLPSLEIVRFLTGIFEGSVWPAFMVLTSRWFPRNERAQAAGLFLLALPLSSVLLSPLAGWMITAWNWQVMFYFQAVPPLILAVLAVFLLNDNPETDKKLSEEERKYILQNRDIDYSKTQQVSLAKAFKSPRLWCLALTYMFWLTGLYAYGLWLPTVIKSLSNANIATVGWLSAVPPLLGAFAMYFNSRLSDRKMQRGFYVIWPLIVGGLSLLVSAFVSTPGLSFLLLCISAIGIYAPFGVWWAWCIENVPSQHVGPLNGFVNFGGNFGGIIGPPVVALASVGGKIGSGFYVLGVGMLLSAILAIALNSIRVNSDGIKPIKNDKVSV